MSLAEVPAALPSFAQAPRYVRSRAVLSRTLPDAAVLLLGPPRNAVLVLAGPAVHIWQAIAAPCELDQLVIELAERYGAPTDVVLRDVATTLDELEVLGAVERSEV